MPILSSSVVSQIRNTNPLITTRVPYSPSDPWMHGTILISPHLDRIFYDGLLALSSTNNQNFLDSGYESGIPFGYQEVDGTQAGTGDVPAQLELMASTSNKFFVGRQNPRFLIKFKFTGSSAYEFFIGFADNFNLSNSYDGDPLGDTDVDPKAHGIGLYANSTAGNFRIISNNGSSGSNFTSSLATYDQNIHTLYLESDYANSRWGYSLDNAAIQYVSTKIPDPETGMVLYYKVLNKTELTTIKRIYLYDFEAWQRRIPVA